MGGGGGSELGSALEFRMAPTSTVFIEMQPLVDSEGKDD